MNGIDLNEYVDQRKQRGFSVHTDSILRLEDYLVRYSRDDDTANAPKWVDGEVGNIIFTHFKETCCDVRHIKRQVQLGIGDVKLTKMFYGKNGMFKTLEGFFDNFVETKRWNDHFKKGLELMKTEVLPQVKFEPFLVTEDMDVRENITNMNSSAGFSKYGAKKLEITTEMIEEAMRIKSLIEQGVKFKDIIVNPCIGLTRSQLGKLTDDLGNYTFPFKGGDLSKYKGRLVWCMDAGVILFESQYARPIINYFSGGWVNIAAGKSPIAIRNHVRSISQMDYWCSLDFSKYDSTIQSWLIKAAFELVKEFFDEIYHDEIDWACYNFIYTEILMPDGKVYRKRKGIPSGSYFTQIIGSLCNAIMLMSFMCHYYDDDVHYIRDRFKTLGNEWAFSVMGDDNVFGLNDVINKDKLREYYRRMFGVEISTEKSTYGRKGTNIEYLKRVWEEEGESREPVDLLLNLLHPERKRSYDGYSPWHILYGYFLTYTKTMKRLGFTERQIMDGMSEFGGVTKMKNMSIRELPGSLAALATSDYQGWIHIIESAEARYQDAS